MGMKIKIVAVGKLREEYWKGAMAEYLKRLGHYADVTVTELYARDPAACEGPAIARMIEGRDILKAVGDDYCILLDIQGTQRSSEELSKRIEQFMVGGQGAITFIVGGATGVSPDVRERANETLSFGPITLPHNLARVVLAEQVYRAFTIMRGEPYHK